MLMGKLWHHGDDWVEKENLWQIFLAQRAIGEEYVDVVSYFGGFWLKWIEESRLWISSIFKETPEENIEPDWVPLTVKNTNISLMHSNSMTP